MSEAHTKCYAIFYKGELAEGIIPAKLFYKTRGQATGAMKNSILQCNKLYDYKSYRWTTKENALDINDFSIEEFVHVPKAQKGE